jgi:hypothetical protein
MPHLAWAPPFVTMTTYCNIFKVVFPKERPDMVWGRKPHALRGQTIRTTLIFSTNFH